jgi:NTP pyrophosphatase (non-canonical NTP hydrolase)
VTPTPPTLPPQPDVTTLAGLQAMIAATFGERDAERGVPSTVAWLAEEIGELAQAVRKGSAADREHEFGDVLAWVASLANQVGVDLTVAVQRYAAGCPKCHAVPCACP